MRLKNRIICVDNLDTLGNIFTNITIGKIYDGEYVINLPESYRINDNHGNRIDLPLRFFQTVESYRNNKIDLIIQ